MSQNMLPFYRKNLFLKWVVGGIELEKAQKSQINIEIELEPEVITLDVQYEGQNTDELCKSSRTHHARIRYRLLMEVENDELLILNETTN